MEPDGLFIFIIGMIILYECGQATSSSMDFPGHTLTTALTLLLQLVGIEFLSSSAANPLLSFTVSLTVGFARFLPEGRETVP